MSEKNEEQDRQLHLIAPEAKPKLIPVTHWPDHHDYPSVGGLRHLIFHADTNGFHKCVRRIGRRVLIDERSYFEWVAEQNPLSSKA
jgi:hypothetical protein